MSAPRPDPTKLRRSRDVIAAGWTQGEDARDADGNAVIFDSTAAVCHCMIGGLLLGGCSDVEITLVYDTIERKAGYRCISEWNDAPERTKADVLALLDEIITQAEAA